MPTRVGVVGAGQLARFLITEARQLGIEITPLANQPDDPAAQEAKKFILKDSKSSPSKNLFAQFLESNDTILFENEFLDFKSLEAAALDLKKTFVPELEALFKARDKLNQKSTFASLKINSAPYQEFVDRAQDSAGTSTILPAGRAPYEWIGQCYQKFQACVLKWSLFGYDGKGNFFVRSPADFKSAEAFITQGLALGARVYAEKLIHFNQELALVSTCTNSGECAFLPLVISQQEDGICKLVRGPALSLGVSKDLEVQAQNAALTIARKLNLIGTFALEFFEADGQLWLNEIAPRVHNSGHFSLDASQTSQFENHVRAALGMPLGKYESAPYFAMLNLIGPKALAAYQRKSLSFDWEMPDSSFVFHWYGKGEVKTGRKMGHLTVLADSEKDLKEKILRLLQLEQEWISLLKYEQEKNK